MNCFTKSNTLKYYALSDLSFVGGHTAEIIFNLKDEAGVPYNAEEYNVYLTVCARDDKEKCFTLECSPGEDMNGVVSAFKIEIAPLKTVNLEGEFIYQLTIINSLTKKYCPLYKEECIL